MAQFVPLKVNTEDESIGEWLSKYSHEGRSIPVLYVIRADGEQLYGKSGGKPGKELPKFLMGQLQQAGRMFSPRDLATLTDVVAKAKEAMQQDDIAVACIQVRRMAKLGKPGELGSYAQPAIEADALVKTLVEQGKAQLTVTQGQIEIESTRFNGLVALATAKRTYGLLPDLKKPYGTALRDIRKNRQTRDLFTQATAIDRVHIILAKRRDGVKVAITILKKIIDGDPNSEAEKYAQEWIERLEAEDSEEDILSSAVHKKQP